ncbi:MAG: acyltransferase [Thermodesulfobacteriota bacterium]|jgi:acetyltransferase-like isoleucine patch superfamily enzyme
MNSFRRILINCVWLLSELEVVFSRPGNSIFLRRIFLRLNKVKFGKALWIGPGFELILPEYLSLGERCALGGSVKIENFAMINIGDDFTGSSGLFLASGSHDPVSMAPKNRPIIIGDRVYCGVNVTILSGVTIGNDVVIGAGSLVCSDIPSNTLAVGVPARVIKALDRSKVKMLWTWTPW